jgi:ATP-dependent helicase YprA (DUF1998 family)
MNALANSQELELQKFLSEINPKVTFARYTGQEGEEDRKRIRDDPPDIVHTRRVEPGGCTTSRRCRRW